ncbi:GTPase HflX [Fulvitalea axinellae]|uniref:GTPase HflX n=1 Tax=Fulvitalea axinellae TaxID=1182444 RepID=A0AAU9CY01_9BACT|nr:GTPase HflX [Fulvitalea axinellae]
MAKRKTFDTSPVRQTAVLVAVSEPGQSDKKTTEYLDELAFLAETLDIDTKHRFTQNLDHPDKRTFVGKGKLEDVMAYVKAKGIDCVIFDDDLSPSQLRNLEKEVGKKIYDRSLLILDIFLKRAQTAQAKTQVELARLQYLLPRLTRMWTHLERQRGGTGTRGGAGEKEIETDRRAIRNQITVLKQKLAKIDKQNETQRKGRDRQVRVALVGYTNVGKSTIMRAMAKADVFAENKLFATVDSTVRKVVIHNIPFLLSDTVGFIRKLPHTLIECFKSTLDEVREADILLHVADISNEAHEDHIRVVNQTLAEIGAAHKPTLLVFNKMDQFRKELAEEVANDDPDNPDFMDLEERINGTTERLRKTYDQEDDQEVVFTSALDKESFEPLRRKTYEYAKKRYYTIFPNYMQTDWDPYAEENNAE